MTHRVATAGAIVALPLATRAGAANAAAAIG